MKLLDFFFYTKQYIFDYFGYVEDYAVIPLDDATEYYWQIIGGDGAGGVVRYGPTEEILETVGDYFEDEIYTQRFLPKWVYRGEDYTMICCDPKVDGNKFLRSFDNCKEVGGD